MSVIDIKPIENILIQGTSVCNLNCSYCYLSEDERRRNQVFALDKLELVFRKLFTSGLLSSEVQLVWHAGEPLAIPVSYYRQAFALIDRLKAEYAPSCFSLFYRITTNATLINQEWCNFFKANEHQLTINVSCDGPDFIHDHYRMDWAGNKTHHKVVEGIELLKKNEIPFQIFATITQKTLDYPDEFFDFFYQYREHISERIQLNPVYHLVENNSDIRQSADRDGEKKFRAFLKALLERSKTSPEPLVFKNFRRMLSLIYHLPETEEEIRNIVPRSPLQILNVDSQGNVSTFLSLLGMHQTEPDNVYGDSKGFFFGNIFHEDLKDMLRSPKFLKMCEDFSTSERACRDICQYFPVCGGGEGVVKYIVNGTFDSSETPDCRMAVQSFVDVLLEDILESSSRQSSDEPMRAVATA